MDVKLVREAQRLDASDRAQKQDQGQPREKRAKSLGLRQR
jgi:hypothetical protein